MKRKIFIILAIALMLPAFCACNKYVVFEDSFVAFLTSDATSIDCTAERDAEYRVHLSGVKPSSAVEVVFSIKPGNGMKEGVDYEINTQGGKLVFLPGIFELPIRIKWLANDIDKTRDNSVTIRLESCNQEVTLGYPGPAENMRQLVIRKY